MTELCMCFKIPYERENFTLIAHSVILNVTYYSNLYHNPAASVGFVFLLVPYVFLDEEKKERNGMTDYK